MSKQKKKHSARTEQLKNEILFEIYGISLLALSLITLASYGAIGRNLAFVSRFLVGTFDFVIPLIGIWLAVHVMIHRKWPGKWTPRGVGVIMCLMAVLTFNHHLSYGGLPQGAGIVDTTWSDLWVQRTSAYPMDVGSGMLGAFMYAILHFLFDDTGTLIMLGAVLISGILLIADVSFVSAADKGKQFFKSRKREVKAWLTGQLLKRAEKGASGSRKRTRRKSPAESVSRETVPEPVIYDFAAQSGPPDDAEIPRVLQMKLPLEQPVPDERESTERTERGQGGNPPEATGREDAMDVKFRTDDNLDHYLMPPLALLSRSKNRPLADQSEMQKSADTLVKKLASFGVKATVTGIHRGPAVTRYEIEPEEGVKVSRIVSLTDDIALALAAKAIRIEAPIPGKPAVGIEVPNSETAMVGLREVLESAEFLSHPSRLCIGLGRDIYGTPVIADLAKMPHLLVAGSTGSGKSVCINAIITSLLYKSRPDEVKLMMIDPKMVELNVYNGIPHLLVPVVTNPRKASVALKKVVAEMEKRYELFAKSGVRDIERYNQWLAEQDQPEKKPLPYIVVIIDELADLMMVAPSDVEDAICRLAQMARAAGIHLIIATQRPSVDVITGVIKANIPTRIAFAVSSQADSRTILDMGGAEKLLGRGDMLYLPVGAAKPIRVQGAFLSDKEVEAVVHFVKKQLEPQYHEEMIPVSTDPDSGVVMDDELYPQAVKLVLEAKTASVSLLQRRLRVGYTRAARLIDMMEANGIVGPPEGSKPREVLMTLEQYEGNKTVAK
ncbi:FtsK/SpoIIIE family DNA translocase [Staphylospora marina]|uniref:FtsK/SpoIIIE family DNA translocase n=1 Tax=Staphylospora marina TaxID=2490858 RepID=UPI000F5B97A1|nr:DNA translocase FtsK [Staphylospora marina]